MSILQASHPPCAIPHPYLCTHYSGLAIKPHVHLASACVSHRLQCYMYFQPEICCEKQNSRESEWMYPFLLVWGQCGWPSLCVSLLCFLAARLKMFAKHTLHSENQVRKNCYPKFSLTTHLDFSVFPSISTILPFTLLELSKIHGGNPEMRGVKTSAGKGSYIISCFHI